MDPPTESIHTMLSGIYDALDPLRELLGGLQYDYPQVMVLGNEKAGKHLNSYFPSPPPP